MHNSKNDFPTNRDVTLIQMGVSEIELFVSSPNRYDMTSKRTVYQLFNKKYVDMNLTTNIEMKINPISILQCQ